MKNFMLVVILVVSNASFLASAAMTFRSKLGHLTFVYDILTSILGGIFNLLILSNIILLVLFSALIPLSAFFFTKFSCIL